MKSRFIYIIIGCVVACLIAAALFFPNFGIFAIQMTSQTKVVNFNMAECKVSVVDEFTEPNSYSEGDVILRNVSVHNDGTAPVYVRIKAVFANSDIASHCTLNINGADYVYSERDNYYYLTSPLAIDTTAPSLFSTITLSGDISSDFSLEMIIYAEGVQSEGFADYEDAWNNFSQVSDNNAVKGYITYSSDKTVVYDGQEHSIDHVRCSVGGFKIFYSTEADGDYSELLPMFTERGSYTVFWRAEKDGLATTVGSNILTIE